MFKLKYFWPYLLFFLSIVVLVIANRVNINNEISRNLSYTKTLNVSGRQRMLSQKLTKLCYMSMSGAAVQPEINEALTLWRGAHTRLMESQDGVSIRSVDHPEVVEMFEHITPVYEALFKDFTIVSNQGIDEELMSRIHEKEKEYLQQMDAIVTRLEENATADLIASKKKQSLLALGSGVFLVLEMIVFIYPYHKRLVNAYKKVKRQQEELEEQKETIEHLYETNELIIKGTNAGIWEWNIITGVENWSDRFFQLLGYVRGDIEPIYDNFLNVLLHPEDKTKILNAVSTHIVHGTSYRHEIRMLNKNGEFKWYETSGQAIWNEKGEAIRMAGSIIDIGSRISTREKLLSESNTKDKLLSIVTHDLRSPVNNLKSLLDLLKENIINKEEFLEHLNATVKNVNSLSQSMDNMLTWAQSQMQGWEVSPSDIILDDAIQECLRLYKNVVKEKKIELSYEQKELINAYADFNQVVLIVRNVLNNAIKFTPEDGTITIETMEDAEYASVVIKDTGKGMDEETIAKVLNKHDIYTTHGTNGEKGTGLGMNMCLEFAEKNKCKFEIESEAGAGTSVYLHIPKNMSC